MERLYNQYGITYVTEGHKHSREGWVNTVCPYCTGNPGYHLGYSLTANTYVCWRCGKHKPVETLAILLHVPKQIAYTLYNNVRSTRKALTRKDIHYADELTVPTNLTVLQTQHKKYLQAREFDADMLEETWGLRGAGVFNLLGNINYKHRIIIPYHVHGVPVSFDSRDITDKSPYKYMACPLEKEVVPHKNILYGKQADWLDIGFCVEGTTDVWRLGTVACATSGIKFTKKQVRELAQNFKKVVTIYDPEKQAQKAAYALRKELEFRGVVTDNIILPTDPADLPQHVADKLIENLINKYYKVW